jgi:CheY-like chemotaxis protein
MSKLIFFVDDDKMIINLLEYTFQSRHQYVVKSFYSGEACLKSLHLKHDLIVLDHQLATRNNNQLNGIQTLEKIRAKDHDVPVIVLTAHGSEELLEAFLNKGAERFLTKDDYFIDSLMESIGEVLN